MAYVKTNWQAGVTPLSEANMDHLETQYDELIALFNAHTILMAITNNNPVPLTMGASTILARLAAGNIVAATPAQLMVLLSGSAGAEFLFNTQKIGGVVDPTTNQQAATKKYVDDQVAGGASLTVSETEVFASGSTTPTAWTDLDLSGTVGANAALVLLKVARAGGTQFVAVRKNGDTDEFYSGTAMGGCAAAALQTAIHTVFLVATDNSGKIEWKNNAARTDVTVDIIAYIK